jgi:hypothetical protein
MSRGLISVQIEQLHLADLQEVKDRMPKVGILHWTLKADVCFE